VNVRGLRDRRSPLFHLVTGLVQNRSRDRGSAVPEDDAYHPQPLTWQDGAAAFSVGPFYTHAYMRKTLAYLCHGRPYYLLDEDDRTSVEISHQGAVYGGVYGGRGKATEQREITVIYRCK
jgi:hypothetical protein